MLNLLSYKVIYFRPNSSRKFKMVAMKTLWLFRLMRYARWQLMFQEQRRVSHPILLLHRTIFGSAFGATSMSHCTGRAVVYPLPRSSQYYLWIQMWNKPWFPFPYLHLKVNTEAMILGSWWRWRKGFRLHKTCTAWWLCYLLVKDLQPQFI